jgi:hypothetical protein
MKFKENRTLAWILVIVIMITSVLISGYVSLSSQKKKVLNSFYDTMDNDLNTKSSYADNLAGIASRYLDSNSKYITDMSKARNMLLEAENPQENYVASVNITNAASAIYDVLGTMELTSTDDRLRRSNYADILAVDDILRRSDFNQNIDKFNEELDKFPASVISSLTNIEKADYFR